MSVPIEEITTGCVAVIVTTTDNFIVLQRRDNAPGIDFPGYLSLIAGRVLSNESPVLALRRELGEELVTKDGSPLQCGPVSYLGCDNRDDRPWIEYVFHVEVFNDASELTIQEGLGLEVFSIEVSALPAMIAPHHRRYLVEYLEKINLWRQHKLERRDLKMVQIKDFYSLKQLGLRKDYPDLEAGDGYVESTGEFPIAGIHTGSDVRFIALLTFKKDTPRGFHYHLRKVENIVVLDGKMLCSLQLVDDASQMEEFTLSQGQVLQVLPGCIHTYTALGGDVQALEFAPQRYEASDVIVVEEG